MSWIQVRELSEYLEGFVNWFTFQMFRFSVCQHFSELLKSKQSNETLPVHFWVDNLKVT